MGNCKPERFGNPPWIITVIEQGPQHCSKYDTFYQKKPGRESNFRDQRSGNRNTWAIESRKDNRSNITQFPGMETCTAPGYCSGTFCFHSCYHGERCQPALFLGDSLGNCKGQRACDCYHVGNRSRRRDIEPWNPDHWCTRRCG